MFKDLKGNATNEELLKDKKQRYIQKGLTNQPTHGWEFVTEQEGIKETSGKKYILENLLTVLILAGTFIIFMMLLF